LPDIWDRLTAAYVAAEQIRHSLVHDRARVDGKGDLIGVDDAGSTLCPVTVAEQEE